MFVPFERYAKNLISSRRELHLRSQEHRTQFIRQLTCTHSGKITKAWGSMSRFGGKAHPSQKNMFDLTFQLVWPRIVHYSHRDVICSSKEWAVLPQTQPKSFAFWKTHSTQADSGDSYEDLTGNSHFTGSAMLPPSNTTGDDMSPVNCYSKLAPPQRQLHFDKLAR